MIQGQNRSLRPRRIPNFHSDDQSINPYSILPNHQNHEMRHTQPTLNNISKILAKFINEANLSYKEHKNILKKQKKDKERKIEQPISKTPLKNIVPTDHSRKGSLNLKHPTETKYQNRKPKDLYSFKVSTLPKDELKPLAQLQQTHPCANLPNQLYRPSQPNLNHAMGEIIGAEHNPILYQIRQLQELCPGILDYINNPTSNLVGFNFPPPRFQNTNGSKRNNNGEQTTIRRQMHESKLFKRASYHVAIAYHIYLKKMSQNKELNGRVDIDPTYMARKYKQEQNKQLDNQNFKPNNQ